MMHEDLDEAIHRIDEAFGAGYAKGHPELVAALVQAAAFDRVAKAITSNPVAGDLARKFLLAELTELTEELEELPPPRKLGENDRLATGYLPRLEFEAAVDEFFARPQTSVRGWEPAAEAQARIVRAVEQILSQTSAEGDLAIVGHGGTGTLLYCHLAGLPIDRRYDQPATNGGNWFIFDRATRKLLFDGWRSIDAPA